MSKKPMTLRTALIVMLIFTAAASLSGSPARAQSLACSPVTSTISAPFSFNGAGTFCWQASSLGGFINSWNLASLTVNGVDFNNRWAGYSEYPPPINGFWYVRYQGNFSWSHFEAAGTGGTPVPTTTGTSTPIGQTNTPTRTLTQGPTPTPSANLLTNGNIESGTTGWSVLGAGTLASNTSVVHGGSQSLLHTGRTAAWNGPRQVVTSVLTNGRTYTTNVWVRSQSGTPSAKVTLQLTAGGTTSYMTLAPATAVNSSSWTLLSGTATVSWSGTLSSANFYVETNSGTDSLYIDDASFSDGASTPPPTNTPTRTPSRTPIGPTNTPTRTNTPSGGFLDNLDSYNTSLWTKADGWTNGDPFNVGWRADHINFSAGIMTITLDNQTCPSGCSNRPYASSEYRRNILTGYGLYEARFKAAKASGIVSSLFTYTGASDGQPWDEIDIEILGKDTTRMQTNYFTNGVGGHETLINLGFDASAGFHTYGIEYRPTHINWYVDGVLVHTENGSRGPLPSHNMKLMMNLWPGIGVDSWLGPFTYTGPLHQQVDWLKYTP